VAALRAALGVTRPAPLDVVEPGYQLDLTDLIVPPSDMTLHPLQRVPIDTLIQWRAAYHVEALSAPLDEAVTRAQSDIDGYIAADSHRSLWAGAAPVAMTGFNAVLPNIVQIGGVYTPPDLRSRGYARCALALHLQEAARQGVTQAVLFAANTAAETAYRAIGFQRSGSFAIAFYDDPQVVDG
jgi:GNAT superfamily N-acetyltransferase